MMTITLWQPWASLVAEGCKPFEFRRWEAPRRYTCRRIAIHAGARPARRAEIKDLIYRLRHEGGFGTALDVAATLPLLERVLDRPSALPHSAIVCTALLGRPRRATELYSEPIADSDRIDQHVWAWPLTEVERLEPPEPATGQQGFWEWRLAPMVAQGDACN